MICWAEMAQTDFVRSNGVPGAYGVAISLRCVNTQVRCWADGGCVDIVVVMMILARIILYYYLKCEAFVSSRRTFHFARNLRPFVSSTIPRYGVKVQEAK